MHCALRSFGFSETYCWSRGNASSPVHHRDRGKHAFPIAIFCKLQLQVLDLSDNMIECVDTQELPRSLIILNLMGNPCCLDPGLRQRLTSSLPALKVGSSQIDVSCVLVNVRTASWQKHKELRMRTYAKQAIGFQYRLHSRSS